jgi:hypothetical protein
MAAEAPEFGWGKLAGWVLATMLGWGTTVPMLMVAVAGRTLYPNTGDYGYPICGIVGCCGSVIFLSGIIIGLPQGRILQNYWGSAADRWANGTMVGVMVGWVLGGIGGVIALALPHMLIQFDSELVDWIFASLGAGAVVGIVTGANQWRVLRRLGYAAQQWVLLSIAAWSAGILVYWLVYIILGGSFRTDVGFPYLALLGSWIAGGLTTGLITGTAIKQILARPIFDQPR